MAQLLLRETPIGTIDGVLFDKDGTLSHSEPHLLDLAERRISAALTLWSETRGTPDPKLHATLSRAFGHCLSRDGVHPPWIPRRGGPSGQSGFDSHGVLPVRLQLA